MSLINKLTNKQKRSIQRDIDLIFSVKGIFIPKTIDDLKEIGFFAPRIKVDEKEIYLSKEGVDSIRRICGFIYRTKLFKGMLSYDDIFHAVSDEIEYWINKKLVPEGEEFILPLETRLLNNIDEYVFVCRIDGLSLEDVDCIVIGNRVIKKYDNEIVSELLGKNELISRDIENEYIDSLIISGVEKGSFTVAKEKFYHNSELSLSILRLYSCSHSKQGIKRTNIRLINNCANAYGPASSFGWKSSDKIISFTRYFVSEHDLKVDSDILAHWGKECFFEKNIWLY